MSSFPRDPAERPAPYERFTEAYDRGNPPWDTNIAPPELVEAVEGPGALDVGQALDLGCGTGTNCLYLARQGWEVTGIDFIANAIRLASEKLRHAGSLAGKVRFLVGDVTNLDALGLEPGYTLLFDLGCLHSIDLLARVRYAQGVTRLAAPGGLFLLYGFMPNQLIDNHLTRAEVQALFEPAFTLERAVESLDRPGVPASWYWLRRKPW
ncbi:MAG TPA: class I SAM-dependent methyltransferase [Ktedonobacterales bacterium]|nr:class I SAM-dependent methyltransferase [Ktedonobacterales bacterium]